MKRLVRLMSAAPKRKANSPYRKMLTESQFRARYRTFFMWYFKRAEKMMADNYKQWAVYSIL